LLGQLTPPLEAAPPTSLTPPSSVGASSPQFSPSVGDLPSPTPTNQLKGAQAQPFSLKEEIKQFEKKYADLVVSVRNAFKRGGFSFEEVQDRLLQLPVSLRQYAKLLQSEAAHLFQASSINELFFILSPHWDFLNPSLLAHLAYSCGDDQTIKSVDKYLGELREFRMRTKIGDLIDKWIGKSPPNTEEIVMELGDNWREKSLEQLEQLQTRLSLMHWFFKGIKSSSVDAVFSLPVSVDIDSLELKSLQEFLREHQVLRILLNGVCILDLQLQQVHLCLLSNHWAFCRPFSLERKQCVIGVSPN